jgi:hypothetical protein
MNKVSLDKSAQTDQPELFSLDRTYWTGQKRQDDLTSQLEEDIQDRKTSGWTLMIQLGQVTYSGHTG